MNIRVYRSKTHKIEEMDLEQYLRGVVPSEIGSDAPMEALKAQAVCARTYAYRNILKDKNKDYDVLDTVSSQVYNEKKIDPRCDEAIKATEGLVMWYDDGPIGAWFSSSNGGRIKSSKEKWGGAALPYSVSKTDPYDTHGGGGHGVGMSQRGAMAMADMGFSFVDILDFYYNAAFAFVSLTDADVPTHGQFYKGGIYTRELRKFDEGEEVLKLQEWLSDLGYPVDEDGTFGGKTHAAVIAFQTDANLEIDGIVGPKTWNALKDTAVDAEEIPDRGEPIYDELPDNIGIEAKTAIANDLAKVSYERRMVVMEVLKYAYDPVTNGMYPIGIYQRGGNLYNTDLTLNKLTEEQLEKYLKTSTYKQYTNNGRDKMMRSAHKMFGYVIGADCSGLIVGVLRLFGYISANEDAIADGLAGASRSRKTTKDAMLPGDWVHKTGHIGVYVGGGYVVEAAGGAYGIQLTKLDDRQAFNFVTRKMDKLGAWRNFRDPKYY